MAGARPLFTWLFPDLAMAASCVTLFYCLFLFQGYQKLFRDSDAGWHIVTGERILATHELPRTDPYSFTVAGRTWLAWEWGSDVMVGAFDRTAGLSGVALFYGAVIAAGAWLWFRLHWELQGNFLLASAMTPLLLSTCNIHWLARPHTIGWLFLVGWVWRLERRPSQSTWKDAIFAAALTALWANLHASFFLAPLVAAIYAAGRRPAVAHPAPDFRIVVASLLGGLANPYTYHLYIRVYRYLTDSDLLSRIGEFQTFNFQAPGAWQIVATVILGMVGGTLALTQRRPEHFLLAALLTAMALRSARALPLAALVLLPIANRAITEGLSRTTEFRRQLDSFLAYSSRLRSMDAGFRGWAIVPLALLACFALLRTPGLSAATGFPPDQFPVAAYSHIPATAHLYAPDKFGGYLIYRSRGTRKVFFDGRSDLYGAAFLKEYNRLIQVLPGWEKYWNSFAFTHALIPADTALAAALQQLGWRPIFQDRTAILLARGGT